MAEQMLCEALPELSEAVKMRRLVPGSPGQGSGVAASWRVSLVEARAWRDRLGCLVR